MAMLNGWRVAGWGTALALLMLPAVAMQFTREVKWDGIDFVVFAAMLASVGLGIEFLVRRGGGIAYRAGATVMMLALFLLVWINLAVGIIGSEQNDANMMYAGVLAVAVGGAIAIKFRAAGMMQVMLGTMAAMWLVAAIALIGDLGSDGLSWPNDMLGVTGIFTALWLLAAGLFARAARVSGSA